MEETLSNRCLLAACLLGSIATPALGDSTFQNTCSEIRFAYSGNNATIQATCVRADGSPNPTSLTLSGISNDNGQLKTGSGPSTFQKSCGNIQIFIDGPGVTLSALCRMTAGSANPTSLPLNNISNNNGTLVQ
jgi:hypothetical protein